ncbi:hypothetical protein ElyMa_006609600 [Elysia marginata]|uniref:Uncharacterized protein n=1 Tax=Elysia marginata TaxID=1093978 RepID=A0AAV4IJL8_9GAST|nr:hypothetical protein ElyMa_006609600 [Elysia marginata]
MGCGLRASPHYKGIAYAKDGDRTLTLLFDIHGFIAGIQVGIPYEEGNPHLFPSENIRRPFALEDAPDQHFITTVYFIKPDKICAKGREEAEFVEHGTGEGLWLQTGQFPNSAIHVPRQETQLGVPWVEGKCYKKMGGLIH